MRPNNRFRDAEKQIQKTILNKKCAVYVSGIPTYEWYLDDMATVYQTVNPAFKNFTDESQSMLI